VNARFPRLRLSATLNTASKFVFDRVGTHLACVPGRAHGTPLYRNLLITLCLGTFIAAPLLAAASRPPNIVIVLVDDMGRQDLGIYGNTFIQTPNIDAFAAESMRWSDAYSSCPVCSPSRVALLTGRSPARARFTGHITAANRHRQPEGAAITPPADNLNLPLDEITLAELLKPAGYVSASVGKWHIGYEGHFPEQQGFDFNIGGNKYGAPGSYFYPYADQQKQVPLKGGKDGEYLTDRLTDEALGLMRRFKDQPLFLYLAHYAVHDPLQAPRELVKKYEAKSAENPRINPVYAAMVERLDTNVGRLLRGIKDLGLEDKTVVIFTSDNGAVETTSDNRPFRSGKGALHEGGIRVPFIMKWPGKTRPGSISGQPTIGYDIFPTVAEITGLAVSKERRLDGRSLVPDVQQVKPASEPELYWYYPHYSPKVGEPGAAYRSGKMKVIVNYDPPSVELYDLEKDVSETTNLAALDPKLAQSMQQKLNARLVDANPILHTLSPAATK